MFVVRRQELVGSDSREPRIKHLFHHVAPGPYPCCWCWQHQCPYQQYRNMRPVHPHRVVKRNKWENIYIKCLVWSPDHGRCQSKWYWTLPLFIASPSLFPSLWYLHSYILGNSAILGPGSSYPYFPISNNPLSQRPWDPIHPVAPDLVLRKMSGETLQRKTFWIILSIIKMLEPLPSFKKLLSPSH